MSVTLSLAELAGIVLAAVMLAATDAASLSRLFIAFVAKKMEIRPHEIMATSAAVDGDPSTDPEPDPDNAE